MLQVSTNGFVSLGDEFAIDSFVVSRFPRVSGQLVPLIAPLWADFNFRDGGVLYYRVTEDGNVLQDITGRIEKRNANFKGYRPQLAVIITWFQGTLFGTSLMVSTIDVFKEHSVYSYESMHSSDGDFL